MAKIELKIGDKTYNRKWVDDVSSTSQTSTDPSGINYGVIPSTGSAKLRDVDGEIRADIESGVLPISNATTKVVINGNQIQEHITSDSNYNIIDRELNLQFSDRLSLLDKVTYEGMPLRDYSMTAYEMLDDVIGSYGGYCKEMPINWVKYQNGDAILVSSKSNAIVVNTKSGYEIIGTPIKVTPHKNVEIEFSISTTAYTALSGKTGIPVQVLNSKPTDSDCSSILLASSYLDKSGKENVGILRFTPTTDLVYLVINFGYAADNQTGITAQINYISVNGNALSLATKSKAFNVLPAIGAVSATIGDKLFGVEIKYPYLPKATYRETIEKFCVLAQMTLALDEDGRIVFYDARPLLKDNEKSTIVPNSYKITNLNKTLFLKNKIDGVDIKQTKFNKSTNSNALCGTDEYKIVSVETLVKQESDNTAAFASVVMITYYMSITVKIPEKNETALRQIKQMYSGVDANGYPKIPYTVAWRYENGNHDSAGDSITYTTTSSGDIAAAKWVNSSVTPPQEIEHPMAVFIKNTSGQEVWTSQQDLSTTLKDNMFSYTNGFYVGSFNILVGKEARYILNPNSKEIYEFCRFIPKEVSISYYGRVEQIDFEEVDCSSQNIENAVTPVSIPTNELLQDEKVVASIRDNILNDYSVGIPTADIDLFCGLGNWENGEIVQPNKLLKFDGEDGEWRVTGRTFKYSGEPTLGLELQKQHDLLTTIKKPTNVEAIYWVEPDGTTPLYQVDVSVYNSNISVLTCYIIAYDSTNVARDSVSFSIGAISSAKKQLNISSTDEDGSQIDWDGGTVWVYFEYKNGTKSDGVEVGFVKKIKTYGTLKSPTNVAITWQEDSFRGGYFVRMTVTNPNDVAVTANWDSYAAAKTGTFSVGASSTETYDLFWAETNQDQNSLDGRVYFSASGFEDSATVGFD